MAGDAVTAFSTNGTMNIVDNSSETADLLLDRIGRSLAYPGSNGFRPHAEYTTVGVGINPVWAAIIGKAYPDMADVQQRLWELASLRLDSWPREHQALLERPPDHALGAIRRRRIDEVDAEPDRVQHQPRRLVLGPARLQAHAGKPSGAEAGASAASQ